MLKEIWLWFKEKLGALLAAIWQKFIRGWAILIDRAALVSTKTWAMLALSVPVVFAVYILIGMAVVNRIDDHLNPSVSPPAGGSYTVSMVSYLTGREVNTNGWTPNDPVFKPGWWLDNTPNFQRGIIGALSRFSFELRDQLGRTRGSSAQDSDLEAAAGNLSIDPNRWVLDFSTSFLPITPSDTYYREAVNQLAAYNARLASGEAVFERRSDNLLATLDRIALDLGASSAALEGYISEHSGGFLPDGGADDLFYQVKGQVYAYTLLLDALKLDFSDLITGRDIGNIYEELQQSMAAAAALDPWVVANGATDGLLVNHLSMQGFYLLRARTQMREITNILLK